MLPLGLVLLPGALLWRAGRWVVRAGGSQQAPPRGLCRAGAGRSLRHGRRRARAGQQLRPLATPSLPRGGGVPVPARADRRRPRRRPRARAVGTAGRACSRTGFGQLTVGTAGALAVLVAVGGLLAGVSLALHLEEFRAVEGSLAPGAVGAVLLLLAQLAYVPNAVVWAISFMLGPGFAFGTGTVIAPTGSALGAAAGVPDARGAAAGSARRGCRRCCRRPCLSCPYLAGVFGGLLMARAAPVLALETAPLWGFACGVLAGCVLGAAGRVRRRPAGRRSPRGGRPVGMAGRRRGGARGGRGGRGDRGRRELAGGCAASREAWRRAGARPRLRRSPTRRCPAVARAGPTTGTRSTLTRGRARPIGPRRVAGKGVARDPRRCRSGAAR